MFQKILLGIALLCVAALGFIAITETKRANYWQNFSRTQAARAARHSRKGEPEEELEEERLTEQQQVQEEINKHEAGA